MTPGLLECDTAGLGTQRLAQLLDLFRACWADGGFSTDDLAHALGGRHFLVEADGRVVSHASVVPRTLWLDDAIVQAGYVEAVATHPSRRREGLASRLVSAANAHIEAHYELGVLSTSAHALYERLGWRRWAGETWVREGDGTLTRTVDEDDGIMVLATARTAGLALDGRLACERRPGDAW